jgi:hypothetical protein
MSAGAVAVFDLKGEALEEPKADEKGLTIRVSDSVQYLAPE